ncbi:hypothetical protein ACFL2Z_00875 [Candidatus Eisenbacteria bacterium]|uniref:Uncharacterized protein n=1 Tax=Eiseniibacteriota bacterium TaxID=2212470 RepID=A0ABV6YN21_UNCEI
MNYMWEFLKRNDYFRRDIEEYRLLLAERDRLSGRMSEAGVQKRFSRREQENRGPAPVDTALTEIELRISDLQLRLAYRWRVYWPLTDLIAGEQVSSIYEELPALAEEQHGAGACVVGRAASGVLSPGVFKKLMQEPIQWVRALVEQFHPIAKGSEGCDIIQLLERVEERVFDRADIENLFWGWFGLYRTIRQDFFRGASPLSRAEGSADREGGGPASERVRGGLRFLKRRKLNTWIDVQVDASRSKKDIVAEVERIVDVAHEILRLEGTKARSSRRHVSKYGRYLKVWDLWAEKRSFDEIARTMYPGEYRETPDKAIARIKGQRDAAYRIIYGEEYRPVFRRAIKNEDLPTDCDKCFKKRKGLCTELCPPMRAYVEQGQRKSSVESLPLGEMDPKDYERMFAERYAPRFDSWDFMEDPTATEGEE